MDEKRLGALFDHLRLLTKYMREAGADKAAERLRIGVSMAVAKRPAKMKGEALSLLLQEAPYPVFIGPPSGGPKLQGFFSGVGWALEKYVQWWVDSQLFTEERLLISEEHRRKLAKLFEEWVATAVRIQLYAAMSKAYQNYEGGSIPAHAHAAGDAAATDWLKNHDRRFTG